MDEKLALATNNWAEKKEMFRAASRLFTVQRGRSFGGFIEGVAPLIHDTQLEGGAFGGFIDGVAGGLAV